MQSAQKIQTKLRFLVGACIVPVIVALCYAVVPVAGQPKGLTSHVEANLSQTGVSNRVTAVLLNYRSFDTLLEVAVLLVALLGMTTVVGRAPRRSIQRPALEVSNLHGVVGPLSAAMFLTAGYLLWVGGHAPGGAFQAGAVLASCLVLLWMSGAQGGLRVSHRTERAIWVFGLTTFMLIGIAVAFDGRSLLQYPVNSAKTLILIVEAACAISIGAILFALFRAEFTPANRSADSRAAGDR